MSEIDRRAEDAAAALRSDVTPAETDAALAAVRRDATRPTAARSRWSLLAVAATAAAVLIAGLVVIARRDPEATSDLPTGPTVPPVTTGADGTAAPTSLAVGPAPAATSAPATEPETTQAATTVPVTTSPATTVAATEPPVPAAPPEIWDLAYVGDDAIVAIGTSPDLPDVSRLYRSDDQGATWMQLADPESGGQIDAVFTDPDHGYLISSGGTGEEGGVVYATTDGAATWFPLPTDEPAQILNIGVGGGSLHALAVQNGELRLFTSVIGRQDSLSFTGIAWPFGAGGMPRATFAFAGDTGLVTVTMRTLVGAATFENGQWAVSTGLDCLNGGVDGYSSGSEGDFLLACRWGEWGGDDVTPDGTQLSVSTDDGRTLTPVPGPPSAAPGDPNFFDVLARPAVGTIVAGSNRTYVTRDEGVTWEEVDTSPLFQLLTAGDLWVGVAAGDGRPRLRISHDAGVIWELAG